MTEEKQPFTTKSDGLNHVDPEHVLNTMYQDIGQYGMKVAQAHAMGPVQLSLVFINLAAYMLGANVPNRKTRKELADNYITTFKAQVKNAVKNATSNDNKS